MASPTQADITTLINAYRAKVTDANRTAESKAMLERYGAVFSPDHLANLTAEDFKSFLLIKNNKHWEGIHRQGNLITKDMPRLREALSILLDQNHPIRHRLDQLFPKNRPNMIEGLGRAVATPILLVSDPAKYGVYNTRSEAALHRTRLWPGLPRGASFAQRYVAVNEVLLDLAQRYNLTLLQLDEVFGWADLRDETAKGPSGAEPEDLPEGVTAPAPELLVRFGVEQHLEDFLVYNWEKTELGSRYDLHEEDGDIGQQFETSVGRIDLLARDKKSGDWVVVELKKGQGSDAVVGQILRYIGWVQEHLASEGQGVTGIIIAGDVDDRLCFALKPLDNVSLLTYSLQFNLQELPT